MLLLVCLLNLIFYAIICLFVLWVLGLILGMFIPGFPSFAPMFGQPAGGPNRAISLVYLLIGIILLINFLLCAFGGGGHELLPPLWNGGYGMR
jgi:hypothetical protein